MDNRKKRKSPVKKFVAGAALVLGLAVMLVACGEMGSFDFESPTPNVDFDRVNTSWSQSEVDNRLRLARTQLIAQSQSLQNQYADWTIELRQQLRPGADNFEEIQEKIDFSDFVLKRQVEIRSYYNECNNCRNNISNNENCRREISVIDVRDRVFDSLDWLAWEIETLFLNDDNDYDNGDNNGYDTRSLFMAQLEMFQLITMFRQRDFLTSSERDGLRAKHLELRNEISGLGGSTVGLGHSLDGATTNLLRTNLERDIMPDAAGTRELRRGLMQQFEDFAQFDAWIQDLNALRFPLFLPCIRN